MICLARVHDLNLLIYTVQAISVRNFGLLCKTFDAVFFKNTLFELFAVKFDTRERRNLTRTEGKLIMCIFGRYLACREHARIVTSDNLFSFVLEMLLFIRYLQSGAGFPGV